MPRKVSEWVGKTDQTPIPQRVKLRIVEAQFGVCACGCGVELGQGEAIEFDHTLALILGGENRETNIRALRAPCHKPKTAADVKIKAKIARVRAKHLGIEKPKSRLPCSKSSPFKKRLDGTVVRRDGTPMKTRGDR